MNYYPKQNNHVTRFIELIEKNINVHRGSDENVSDWKKRLAYSAVGVLALASLWDINDTDDGLVSIVSFKSKIKKEVLIYNDIFAINLNPTLVADEIYQQYLDSGFMYHKKNRITYSSKKFSDYGKVRLIRSSFPDEISMMSGLGLYDYTEVDNGLKEISGVFELFNINEKTLKQTYKELQAQAKWEKVPENLKANIDFLNNKEYQIYWTNNIDSINNNEKSFSLLRVDLNSYYLYFTKNSELYVSPLNLDNFDNSYLKPAASILDKQNALRSIKYSTDEKLVKVRLGYKLSPREESFFKLYSWPSSRKRGDFERLMSIDIFVVLKKVLETIGYKLQGTEKW